MDDFEFQFEAKVDICDFGTMAYTVVYAPSKLTKQLDLTGNPRLRIDGNVAGTDYHGAFQPAGNHKFYLILSKKFRKLAGIELGDRVYVSFNIADQNAVDVPQELQFALNANDQASKIWESLTPGKRRGFAYRNSSAKRACTRENRVEEVIEALLSIASA